MARCVNSLGAMLPGEAYGPSLQQKMPPPLPQLGRDVARSRSHFLSSSCLSATLSYRWVDWEKSSTLQARRSLTS